MNNIVFPDYNHSILNLITSILKYYNVDSKHSSLVNLDEKLNNKNYKNIVLIILDGLGKNILDRISPDGFFERNKFDCITSVYPSSTTAALTTYYSGKPPYETGWIGWTQYFKEYGRSLNMLPHTEAYKGDLIDDASINVFETLVNYEPIFSRIEKASPDVKAFEIMPTHSDRRSKRTLKADTVEELVEGIELICNTPGKNFIMAYSDNPDALMHNYGTDSEESKYYILDAEKRIKDMCSKLDDDTLVIISADHGHLNIEDPHSILDFPELLECLYMPAVFESRGLTFWVKENMKETFEKRFNDLFKDKFILLTKDELLNQKHLLGYGNKHPKIDDFIGDYFAISISSSIINVETFLTERKAMKISAHCGLTKDEMEVPLIVFSKNTE